MSGENPSVELAPLRGSIVIDLDNFNEGIEEVESKVESLKELFDDISLNFNLDGINEIQSQLSDVTSQLDNLDDLTATPDIDLININTVLDEIDDFKSKIESFNDESIDPDIRIDGLTTALGGIDELRDKLDELRDTETNTDIDLTGINIAEMKLDGLQDRIEDLRDIASAPIDLDVNNIEAINSGLMIDTEKASGFGDKIRDVSEKLRSFGMQGTMMFTVPVVMGLVKASEASAKFGASINLAKNEFGKANTSVLDFSNNALKGLDMSNGAALSLTDTFGLSVNALGANKVQSAELSMQLTRLAQNMNLGTGGAISLQDATQALTGMLGGQDYALKSMGISLSNTELNQAALNSQYHKAFKNLTPYQQAVIETKVVQDKLNKSLGPLNKNLNSQYGATERAKGSFTELAENLGSTLTPEIKGLTDIIEKLNNWFSHLSPHSKALVKDAIIGAAVLPPLALAIGGISSVVDVLSGALLFLAGNPIVLAIAGVAGFVLWCHHLADESKKSTDETKKNFMRLNKGITVPINEASKNGKEKLGGLSRYMLKTSYESTNKTSENFKTMGKNINKSINEASKNANKEFDEMKKNINSDVNSTKNNVSNKWGEMTHDVTNKSNSMSSNTTQTFRGMNKGITSSVNNTTSHVVGKFADMRNNVTSTSSNMNSTTTVTFSSMCNSISNSMDRAGDWIRSQWDQSYNDTEANVNNIERSAETHFNSIENSIGNYMNRVAMHIHSGWDAAVNATGRELDNLDSEAHQKWGGLESWWSNVVKDLPNDVNNIGGELEQAGSNIINSLLSGIEGAWGDVTSWIGNALSNLASSADSEAHHIISSIDGSHATGLNYVPWDGYNATLHKGEMILTESEANQYRNGAGVGGNTNITVNTTSSDPWEIASSIRREMNQMINGF